MTEEDEDQVIGTVKKRIIHILTILFFAGFGHPEIHSAFNAEDLVAADSKILERCFAGIVFIEPERKLVGVVVVTFKVGNTVAEIEDVKRFGKFDGSCNL